MSDASGLMLPPFQQQYILLEYRAVGKQAPNGVYIVPSARDVRVWEGVIFVHSGLYKGGIFKFIISFPEAYPSTRPSVRFVTNLFHPCVSQQGELDLEPRFHTWDAKTCHAWDVVEYIKGIFAISEQTPFQSEYNSSARELLTRNSSDFMMAAMECSLKSQEPTNDESLTFMRFLNPSEESLQFRTYILDPSGADKTVSERVKHFFDRIEHRKRPQQAKGE
eukprot:TRINITY_DN5263_c0_g2_i2.p1 TRINITY_DN5263_c0_g2~~TRINITY_DN5263_c0_g2_i2.p1  ORF type:complete len:221 (-),score=38.21 TRINITY_DN5263_c0_g2_i2:152-814(-)